MPNEMTGGLFLKRKAVRAALQMAIDAGDNSGIADGNSFDRVRQALKLPAKPHRRKSVVRRDPLTVLRTGVHNPSK
jgi:hypothetical protein